MLLPVGTDVRLHKPPVGNYAIILLNVVVFLAGDVLGMRGVHEALPALNAAAPMLYEYLTYQFRHGDLTHLLGNMFFLWIFGNAVCDRMGSRNYVLFYLAGGVIAGVAFTAHSQTPMVGASGAIAAVTTAFLALFPKVRITLLLWFFVVTVVELPALVVIVFKIILWDNVFAPYIDSGRGIVSNVAHSAHLGGYTFGFVIAMLMLRVRALPRNQFDMLALASRWQRRRGLGSFGGADRFIVAREVGSQPLDEPAPAVSPVESLRQQIVNRIIERDFAAAVRMFHELQALDATQVLPRREQLELANYLAQSEQHELAASTYEAFLSAYGQSADAAQVRLLTGLIYSRYLHRPAPAETHLRAALAGLTLESQRMLAEDELEHLRSASGDDDEARDSSPR